eukprot:GHVU01053598.1.p1 GENE.GHVU01053598.1~~GHVU01053598.1.p1  ORF type:complete len:171 (+),score=15.44 GHVU01053598.1:127-639(+)
MEGRSEANRIVLYRVAVTPESGLLYCFADRADGFLFGSRKSDGDGPTTIIEPVPHSSFVLSTFSLRPCDRRVSTHRLALSPVSLPLALSGGPVSLLDTAHATGTPPAPAAPGYRYPCRWFGRGSPSRGSRPVSAPISPHRMSISSSREQNIEKRRGEEAKRENRSEENRE